MLQGIEGWLAEQVERGSDAPVDTLEKSKSVLVYIVRALLIVPIAVIYF